MPPRFFDQREFDSPDAPGSGKHMDPFFIDLLDQMRERCGFAFKVHSGYRTPARNRAVGGVNDSSHEKGCAADVEVATTAERFKFLEACFHFGVQRVGIGETFIHVDTDPTKPAPVVWFYKTGGGRA
jgi:uncharacterized protein YcbK (DUF882 family)